MRIGVLTGEEQSNYVQSGEVIYSGTPTLLSITNIYNA